MAGSNAASFHVKPSNIQFSIGSFHKELYSNAGSNIVHRIFKPSCHIRFTYASPTAHCVLEVIRLILSNDLGSINDVTILGGGFCDERV